MTTDNGDGASISSWQLLGTDVLFGVQEDTGLLLLGSQDGQVLWACWTDQEQARTALPTGYALRHATVRSVLPRLDPGVALVLDPGGARPLALDSATVDALKDRTVPFPEGAPALFGEVLAPPSVRTALRGVRDRHSFVEQLWFFAYRLGDGPDRGCIAYRIPAASVEAQESVVTAVRRVLDETVRGTDLDRQLNDVVVLDERDLPEPAREWLTTIGPVA